MLRSAGYMKTFPIISPTATKLAFGLVAMLVAVIPIAEKDFYYLGLVIF